MRARPAVVVLPCLVLAAISISCRPATDLNRPCFLIKRNPDGGTPLRILESEVLAKVGRNKDFISLGSIECDELVCVRDSNYPIEDGGTFARGYCSRACEPGTQCPSFDPQLDLGDDRLNCRPLLLDRGTLREIDGGVANVREPTFCARGETPDAGI